MKRILNISIVLFFFFCIPSYNQTVFDIDMNEYDVVKIGEQEWLKENLKVTRFNNGVFLQTEEDSLEWLKLNHAAYCWYNNDELLYKPDYGALYNIYAVENGNLCPIGWKVPDKQDILELITYLDPTPQQPPHVVLSEIAGGMLKESGYSHWPESDYSDQVASNSSGFTALPGGCRGWEGWYNILPRFGYFWLSTGEVISLRYGTNRVFLFGQPSNYIALSVRCIRDTTVNVDPNPEISIILYPNPATDFLYISITNVGMVDVKIYNELILVKEYSDFNSPGIDVSSFVPGFYYILFYDGSTKELIKVEKIIII